MSNLKQVYSQPTSGQFVEIWECSNTVWSETCKYVNGELLQLGHDGTWENYIPLPDNITSVIWFVNTDQITVTLETTAVLEEVSHVIENYNGEVTDCEKIREDANTVELKVTLWFESFNDYTAFVIEFLGKDLAADHIAETMKNRHTESE